MIKPMYKEYTLDYRKPLEAQLQVIVDDWGCGATMGLSPGGAADYLGITRQSVYEAINRGALRACKIYAKRKHLVPAKMTEIYVDIASLEAYKQLRIQTGGRVPFGSRAIA